MRLTDAKIRDLAAKTAAWLGAREDVELHADPSQVASLIARVIREELEQEDLLDRDVETIIARYRKAMDSEGADPSIMRLKIKKQLAKERGIVL
jgi:hypothetical protein